MWRFSVKLWCTIRAVLGAPQVMDLKRRYRNSLNEWMNKWMKRINQLCMTFKIYLRTWWCSLFRIKRCIDWMEPMRPCHNFSDCQSFEPVRNGFFHLLLHLSIQTARCCAVVTSFRSTCHKICQLKAGDSLWEIKMKMEMELELSCDGVWTMNLDKLFKCQ